MPKEYVYGLTFLTSHNEFVTHENKIPMRGPFGNCWSYPTEFPDAAVEENEWYGPWECFKITTRLNSLVSCSDDWWPFWARSDANDLIAFDMGVMGTTKMQVKKISKETFWWTIRRGWWDELCQANLRGADLRNGHHFGRLCGADLRNADCRGANFDNCDMYSADMRGAKIAGASFVGATTTGRKRRKSDAAMPWLWDGK